MRQQQTITDEWADLPKHYRHLADKLRACRDAIAKQERLRDEYLATALSPDMSGEKMFSYRFAAEVSGVSHETLRRRFGGE